MMTEHPSDPKGLIRQAFEMGEDFPGPAEDVFLGWTLQLSDDTDATTAAATLLAIYPVPANLDRGSPLARLTRLLHEAAENKSPRSRGRRGGWRAKRGHDG